MFHYIAFLPLQRLLPTRTSTQTLRERAAPLLIANCMCLNGSAPRPAHCVSLCVFGGICWDLCVYLCGRYTYVCIFAFGCACVFFANMGFGVPLGFALYSLPKGGVPTSKKIDHLCKAGMSDFRVLFFGLEGKPKRNTEIHFGGSDFSTQTDPSRAVVFLWLCFVSRCFEFHWLSVALLLSSLAGIRQDSGTKAGPSPTYRDWGVGVGAFFGPCQPCVWWTEIQTAQQEQWHIQATPSTPCLFYFF